MRQPVVSVVMAVYNEQPYLEEAVQSILGQTFEDFEFIIVNDGSTDGSKDVLERFAERDDRIRLIHQENRGLIPSLNRGLSMAKGRYVARMDGDDVSHARRLERQVQLLNAHPEVGVVGTKIEYIDVEGRVTGHWPLPTNPEVIAGRLLFNNCLCHPSIVARRTLLRELGGYAEWAKYAEDYELWTRAVKTSRIKNVCETLLKLRRHEGSVTVSKRVEQIRMCGQVAFKLHQDLLGSAANQQHSKFLVWMETKGIEKAVEETGVQDFVAVHEYLRVLYRAYAHQLRWEESNVRVRQLTLPKLDAIAERITEQRGWEQKVFYKVRARCMYPVGEVFPWIVRAVRQRIY